LVQFCVSETLEIPEGTIEISQGTYNKDETITDIVFLIP
jgi:hypothetical protein